MLAVFLEVVIGLTCFIALLLIAARTKRIANALDELVVHKRAESAQRRLERLDAKE